MFQPDFDEPLETQDEVRSIFGELNENRDEVRSLADFQSQPAELLAHVQRSHKPLVLTVEDKPAVVVQDAETYQRLRDRIYELEVIQAIQVGLEDVKAGRVRPAREALAELGAKLGFSR